MFGPGQAFVPLGCISQFFLQEDRVAYVSSNTRSDPMCFSASFRRSNRAMSRRCVCMKKRAFEFSVFLILC